MRDYAEPKLCYEQDDVIATKVESTALLVRGKLQ